MENIKYTKEQIDNIRTLLALKRYGSEKSNDISISKNDFDLLIKYIQDLEQNIKNLKK